MSVTVHEAREIPTKERGGAQHSQVRLMLLPTRKTKHRTKIRTGDDNPKFEETFTFKVPPGRSSFTRISYPHSEIESSSQC